ncbi:hypothetical protein E2C01_071016 [Portunus trituberculatus]|uniref:Uncharacterized protein n=1 Tax=Portunus trituberculatus TaxID=210409 RepID=A0A5B7I433_PORTR|nr:hypothetical protein [Portunus trituberculatus]
MEQHLKVPRARTSPAPAIINTGKSIEPAQCSHAPLLAWAWLFSLLCDLRRAAPPPSHTHTFG